MPSAFGMEKDRRGFLRALVGTGAAAAALVQSAAIAPAASAAGKRRPKAILRPKPRPRPVRPRPAPRPGAAPATDAFTLHLLRRATYAGPTPEMIAEVAAAGGPRAWLEAQLAPAAGTDRALDTQLDARFPLAHATPPQLHAHGDVGNWDGMQDLVAWTVGKRLWTSTPVFEMTVEFFSDHLNIATPSSEPWATKPSHDADVIRRHAFGTFSDMLADSLVHPAMLQYLTNTESAKDAPNENLGRELLELHTVGRDAGYGQDGVVNSARILTGLTVWSPWNGGSPASYGLFRYEPDWHWTGPVKVLEFTHPNSDPAGGTDVAQAYARYLAAHPLTAARLARKLAVRFVADSPPQTLVDLLARTYLASGTAIVPVLRALFASPEFAASAGQKYRRPFEDAAATARALGVTIDARSATPGKDVSELRWAIGSTGHPPLGWHPPDGYPDVTPAWLGTGTTLARWNLHVALAGKWWKDGLSYPDLTTRLLGGTVPTDRRALVSGLFARLIPGVPVPAAQHDALVGYLGGDGPIGDGDLTWRFELLVALVLDSPAWGVR